MLIVLPLRDWKSWDHLIAWIAQHWYIASCTQKSNPIVFKVLLGISSSSSRGLNVEWLSTLQPGTSTCHSMTSWPWRSYQHLCHKLIVLITTKVGVIFVISCTDSSTWSTNQCDNKQGARFQDSRVTQIESSGSDCGVATDCKRGWNKS